MSGAGILMLAHRVPWPPDRGDRIRSWHVLRHLAAQAPVHLGALAEPAGPLIAPPEIEQVTASRMIAPRRHGLPAALALALAKGLPLSLTAFAAPALAAWVRATLAREAIAAIYVYSGQMAQFVPPDWSGRVVMDFVDVDSAKFVAYARRRSLTAPLHAREARRLAAWEAQVAQRAAVSLAVSEAELALLRKVVGRRPALAVSGNGIDTTAFAPGAVDPLALAPGQRLIVFTGQMDYLPNVAAVGWFADQVLPELRRFDPSLTFAVVGRAPVSAVRRLAARPGVLVTGEVPDVRPWLAAAAVVVAPLAIARGVQNKVLEAMAMARPVVASPAAAAGLPVEPGRHLVVADGAVATRAAVAALLAAPAEAAALGAAGRAQVVAVAGWDQVLAPLAALCGVASDG